MKKHYNLNCNIAQSLNILGDRWTLLLLHAIMVGNHTYKELQDELVGIPTNILSTRLKELEENNLIICTLYQLHPPRYQYELSDSGKGLQDVFNALLLWGDIYLHNDKCNKILVAKDTLDPVEIVYRTKSNNILTSTSVVTIEKNKQ